MNNKSLPEHDGCTHEIWGSEVSGAPLLEVRNQLPEAILPGVRAPDHLVPGAILRPVVLRTGRATLRYADPMSALVHRRPGGLTGVADFRSLVVRVNRRVHVPRVHGRHQKASIRPIHPTDEHRWGDSTGAHEEAAPDSLSSSDPSSWHQSLHGSGRPPLTPHPGASRIASNTPRGRNTSAWLRAWVGTAAPSAGCRLDLWGHHGPQVAGDCPGSACVHADTMYPFIGKQLRACCADECEWVVAGLLNV